VIRRNPQWVHAAKVALGATAIVAAVAVVVTLAANLFILDRLGHTVDVRLSSQLATAQKGPIDPLVPVNSPPRGGDLDDAPSFMWVVGRSGRATALSVGAPALPSHHWSTDPVTLSVADTTFRFAARPTTGGWLVAGESVVKVGQARADLLVAEALLGALLLVVTFGGSFIIGLRASAPIEQIRRRQAEFTADASHELRTPLSVIEAEVDLALSRERDAASYQTTLRRISSESGRLHSIVEDLLWLARADGDRTGERSDRSTDVAAVGATCVSRLATVADAASVTLVDRTRPGTSAQISADPDSVDRLITVLVDNACRYSGEGGTVELQVAEAGGQVVLTVDDSGPGIPEEHHDLVFDRFHRASDLPGGTGLGLAIADAVVRNSGGTWAIGTSPRGGARMQVSWRQIHGPASREPAPTPTPAPAPAGPTAPSPSAPGTPVSPRSAVGADPQPARTTRTPTAS
jgi:signal transduction histidine kinase